MKNNLTPFTDNRNHMMADNKYSKAALSLYIRINDLSQKGDYCTATNKYLSNIVNKSERQVTNILKLLEEGGFIKCKSITNDNNTKRKIYILQEYLYVDEQESSEESVSKPDNIIKYNLDDIVKDLPDVKPPAGLAGPIPRKKKTKSKEERSRESRLKNVFEEMVYNIYPVDKRGVQSKMFTLFKNLPYDDIKMVISNTSTFVKLKEAPYHPSLKNYIESKLYTDDAIESITKQQEDIKMRERDKNGSSTALRAHQSRPKYID